LINRPNIFVANAIYFLPALKDQNSIVSGVLGGWELGGITQFASGTSTTIYQNGITDAANGATLNSLFGTGNNASMRPLATGAACDSGNNGADVINPNAITLVGYTLGTLPSNMEPRGYCRGPHYVNTDFSIDKNWNAFGEKLRIQFRLDFFNVFNHANFRGDNIGGVNGGSYYASVNCGQPAGGVYSPCSQTNNVITRQSLSNGAGFATATRGPREIQYGLKLIF
jgi:hypothetical protein